MSFTVNGESFYPKTTTEHARDILDRMNALLSSSGLPTMSASQANALWWVMLACGNKFADKDQELLQASQSFDIANCEDSQVLDCLPITGTNLLPATNSTVTVRVYSKTTGTVAVVAGVSKIAYGDGNFVAAETKTVPVSVGSDGASYSDIIFYSDITGPVKCSAHTLLSTSATAISPTLANLFKIDNLSDANVGRNEETVSEVRSRLLIGGSIGTWVTGAETAIRQLTGITHAKVYFNTSTSANLVLSGVTISPRYAYVAITGYSTLLAETFFKYMACQSQGSLSQIWTSSSGQNITLNYDQATGQQIWVRVSVLSSAYRAPQYDASIREILYTLNDSANIGQLVTSQHCNSLFENFTQASVLGVEISSNGSTWTSYVQCDANKYPLFTNDLTHMVVVEV